MITKYKSATNKIVYGDYKPLLTVLFIISIIGSAFSGYTEWYGFSSDGLAEYAPILYPALGIALVESTRWIIPLLMLTLFRLSSNFRKEWSIRIPALLVLAGASIFLTIVSIEKSKDGINYKVTDSNKFVDTVSVDETKYKVLTAQCESQYKSEKNRIESDVKQAFDKDLKSEKRKARAAKQRISQIKHSNATWAVKTVSQKKNVLQVAMGTIKDLTKEMQQEIENRSNLALANYEACKASTKDTLLYYTNKAESTTNRLKKDNVDKIERNIIITNLAMYAGVLFIWIYSIARAWLFHVSGKERIYEFGEEDKDFNFLQKSSTILSQYLRLMGNGFLEWFGASLEHSKQQKNKKTQQALIKQQEQQAKHQQDIEKQQQAFEIQKAKIEAEKAKAQAEAEKAKTQAIRAKIEAEKAATLAIAKAKLENDRLERQAKIEQQDFIRKQAEAAEKQRIKEQQQQIEQQRQQEIIKQQQLKEQQQLLIEAKRIEAEQQQAQQQQIEVKKELNNTLNNITTTVNNIDYQSFISDLIKKHTSNDVLVMNTRFKTPIRQWYERWKKAETKLKGNLSDGKRKQIQKGCDSNRNKYNTAVATLKNQGIQCAYNSETNRVEFKKVS